MNEQQRQLDYIEKAKAYVEALTQQLGRKATCCVTTFGCQMNARDSEKLVQSVTMPISVSTEDWDI